MIFLPAYHAVRLRFTLQKQKLEYKDKELALRQAGRNVAKDPYMHGLEQDILYNAQCIRYLLDQGKNDTAV